MKTNELCLQAYDEGQGIFRLAPNWVPRSFCRPGRRLKLHPDDYYSFGLHRGGIDERWLSSTTHADNGPETLEDEGLSYIVMKDGTRILLRELVSELKDTVIGSSLWNRYGLWPMFSKFFDNMGPLPHHVHHKEEHARLVGMSGKPEMYFFPSQMNDHTGEFAYTFFGLNPEVTKKELKNSLEAFDKGDNEILKLSRAYKLTLDTGWDVPPGVLHAPGSLCTYEPQFASDVYAMYQSVLLGGHVVPESLLWKNCPDTKVGNFDYLIEVLDWNENVDPQFTTNHYMKPMKIAANTQEDDYTEEWICYLSKLVCAKRLTVFPGKTITIHDAAAYGMILLQGEGTFGNWKLETPTLIRFGEITNDEFFVSETAAIHGVRITNTSMTQPIVMLKHFSENPDLPEHSFEENIYAD